MELSLREAATMLNRPVRTLRAQAARGDVPASKRNGRWVFRQQDLPLGEEQRARVQRNAAAVREAVEAALPSRMASWAGDTQLRLVDRAAWLELHRLCAELQGAEHVCAPAALAHLRQAATHVAEEEFVYERAHKLAAVDSARREAARAMASLLLSGEPAPTEPVAGWCRAIEERVRPALAEQARRAARLPGKRRR